MYTKTWIPHSIAQTRRFCMPVMFTSSSCRETGTLGSGNAVLMMTVALVFFNAERASSLKVILPMMYSTLGSL